MPDKEKRSDNYVVRDGETTHGGVTQIGAFDAEEQKKAREKAEKESQEGEGAYLNENDPALPDVDPKELKKSANDDSDRDSKETKKEQGKPPQPQ